MRPQPPSPKSAGAVLLGARHYSPSLGRFLTRDPLGVGGGANPYAYCGGDPLDFHDPRGLLSHDGDWSTPDRPERFGSGLVSLKAGSAEHGVAMGMLGGLKWTLAGAAFGAVGGGLGMLGEEGVAAGEAYQGVQNASKYLKDAGVPRNLRKQILESFEKGTIQLRQAGDDEYGIRYYDGVNAQADGRYLFETFPATQDSLAVLPEWNQMTAFQQWRIRPGAMIIEGRAAPQGWYTGGQIQKFVLDLNDLILP